MVSIIDAITNLLTNPIINLNQEYINSRNRANSMGAALEEYVKDLFAGTIDFSPTERAERFQEVFSWGGNQNNPPDFMIRGGDAVEVKKIESPNGTLALNSSYPKHKLYADSLMIAKACKKCEKWDIKDIIYVTGIVLKNKTNLSSLAFVYGEDYAASREIYERIRTRIKDGVVTTPDVEFQDTKELGKVKRVDPLGITDLRIRGMWEIENPFVVFREVYERDNNYAFNFMAIINEEKWNSLEGTEELERLIAITDGADLREVKIKNPDNPVILKKAKLISYRIRSV